MRLEVSTQLWFIRAPSRLCLMECHKTLSTEGCMRQRRRRREEEEGAAAGSQNRWSWINAQRCKVSSQAQPTASSAPHMIYPKVTTQKLKIKSNKSCSEELSQLMESKSIKMDTTGRASKALGSRSIVITTTVFCPFKFGFDICDYTRQLIGFSLHFQSCSNLIFFSLNFRKRELTMPFFGISFWEVCAKVSALPSYFIFQVSWDGLQWSHRNHHATTVHHPFPPAQLTSALLTHGQNGPAQGEMARKKVKAEGEQGKGPVSLLA